MDIVISKKKEMLTEESKIIKESKELIRKGLTETCISHLHTSIQIACARNGQSKRLKEVYDRLILISANFQILKKQSIEGIQNIEEYNFGMGKINLKLINFLSDIDDPDILELIDFSKMSNKIESIIEDLSSDEIEITINRDFKEYSEKDQEILLNTITNLLNIEGSDIKIKKKRPGSTKITLQLSKDNTEKLEKLIKNGALEELQVIKAEKEVGNSFIKHIHEKHFEVLYQYALGALVKNQFEASFAEDLMQDFYLNLLSKQELAKKEYSSYGVNYLFKIIKKQIQDLAKSIEGKIGVKEVREENDDDYFASIEDEVVSRTKTILKEQFGDEEADVFELYINGYTFKEIGEISNMKTSIVTNKIHKIRSFLKNALE